MKVKTENTLGVINFRSTDSRRTKARVRAAEQLKFHFIYGMSNFCFALNYSLEPKLFKRKIAEHLSDLMDDVESKRRRKIVGYEGSGGFLDVVRQELRSFTVRFDLCRAKL